jgi:hypothetical protein
MIITGAILTDGFNFRSQYTAPDAPTISTITILSNTSANVRFTAPAYAGHSPIIGYTAIAFPGSIRNEVLNPNASNITITGLSDNTYYTFSVTANNSEAPSSNSASSAAMLTDGYPPAPTIGYAEYTSTTTANIVYTAPAYNGNSAITSYTAVSNVGNITATVSTANSGNILVTGLPNNITYGFTVYATNQYGSSAPSGISNGIFASPVIFTPPAAPTIVYALVRDGVSANIVYTAPALNGNSTITSYTARSTPGNVTATVNTANSGNISIGGLTRNTAYTFTVTANNAIGTSANSAISNSITTLTVPDAPIMATWEASDGAANIGYTAPSFNGNSPIVSYTLTTVPENRTVTRQGAGSSNISITGLDFNTTYVFAVYATNSVGSSILSSFSGYLTPTLVTDTFFKYVTLLISANGTNNANNKVFVDSSTNNFAITRVGDSTPGTFAPYGTKWSNYFDGSSYMYPDSALNTAMGAGFAGNVISFEMWIYPTNFNGGSYGQSLTGAYAAVAANGRWLIYLEKTAATTSKLNFSYTTGTGTQNDLASTASAITQNQWNHIAVTVDATTSSSATVKLFANGVLLNTFTSQNMSTQTAYYRAAVIGGANSQYVSEFFGYISDFRILKGSFAYTGNYTVPTAPLTAITNTVLLTCQSYGFKDNATNNHTLTLAGTPKVLKFSPYASDKSYPADVYSGSVYLDGNDALTIPDSTAFTMGTNNFTIECWVYLSSVAQQVFIGTCDAPGNQGSMSFVLGLNGTSFPYVAVGYAGTMYFSTFGTTAKINQWYHIAGVRNGAMVNVYVNGVKGPDLNMAALAITDSSQVVGIGRNGAGNFEYVTGWISDVRIVNGTAVYTANTTPPTTPLTAIANTQLLCNFTNAGIYDASMNTNLRTVNDVKLSTTQYRYGLSSMFFDGTTDFVTVTGNQQALYSMGTADFTIEMWVYTLSNNGHLIDTNNGGDASGSGRFAMQITSNQLQAYNSTGTTMIIGGTINTNQWYHIAYARASGVSKLFIDGEQVGSTYTDTNNFVCGNANRPVFGVNGYDEASTPMNGYIDDLRITQGYARYTTTGFAPPQRAFETK